MKRYESTEDYLETILLLQRRTGMVRSVDIAAEMGFSKPSVSVAMKNLREKGFLKTEDGGAITFTEAGRSRAEQVYERHMVLTQLLLYLGVSEENAKADACRIEHDISEETFDKIKRFVKDKGKDIS